MSDPPSLSDYLSKNWSTLLDVFVNTVPFAIKGYQWIRNRFKWRGISEGARKIALSIHSFSFADLQKTAPVVNIIGLISRPEIDQILEIWKSTDTPLLLQGEAGTGKSGIALRLGQALANDGIPVLFIRATDYAYNQEPVILIQNRMAMSIPLVDALAKLSIERTCSVIVDQLDSVAGTDLGKNFVSFLKALAGIPNIKVLAVSRSYEFLHDTDISSLGFQTIESGNLTNEQALKFLSLLGLSAPTQIVIDLARNLLNLSLISDILTLSPNHSEDIVGKVELWKQFLTTIQQREGDEAAEFAMRLAREVTVKGESYFPVQFPNNTIRRRLLSRSILIELPGRRFTFRHEQLQDFLCAYSLLPEQPTVLQLLDQFGDKIPKSVIAWLHLLYHTECSDVEPTFIDDVLGARESLPFYTRTAILENLKLQMDPTEVTGRVILKYSDDWAYQRYFFESLENPAWVVPLYRTGFFHKLPGPIKVQPGSYTLPGWPAGEYLVRFADRYEEIVLDVIQSSNTENWRVQVILTEALMKISPIAAAKQVSFIDMWLESRFSDMLPNDLIPLADYLCETGFVSASIKILESVITPILPPNVGEVSKYRSDIRFRSDHFWVNQYCEKQVFKLMSFDPVGVVSAFERQIEKTIELTKQVNPKDAELHVGYYWRMDIPNRPSERSDADALDILVDGLRGGLAELCKQSTEVGGELLKAYLSSEHIIFVRIALFTLRAFGNFFPELVNRALLQRNYSEKSEYANEYNGLLRDQFTNASEEVKTQVINWILAGPMDVETRVTNLVQWQGREITENDRRVVKELWTLEHLELIRDHLSSDFLNRLNELVATYGKPDIEERLHIVTTSGRGVPSPVPADELAKKTFEELKQLFLTYVPEDTFLNPRDSLAQTFQGLVQEDPIRYIDFAAYLIDPAIRFVYIQHYLSGIRESVKNKGSKIADAIISLCEYTIAGKEDPFVISSGRDEPGLFAAQMEVADLLEETLHSDDPYLTRGQLDRVRSLLIALTHHPDPKDEEDSSSGIDPFTRSLNCVRGEAMHGVIHYSLYVVRQYEKLNNKKLKVGFLESDIQEILEEKLDLTIEPSLAVHSVYGAFFPQLQFLASGWLEKHLTEIFPEDEDKKSYWNAAWDAYIFASHVYRDVFNMLIPQYQRGLRLLSQPQTEQKHFGGSPIEHLAQHIMFAYLANLTDFGSKNLLLDLFFANATDPIRAHGIFWLSQVLGDEKPSTTNPRWKKCWALWQKRLQYAETQEVSQNTQEISNYMRWLDDCPFGLDILYPTLCQTVKYLYDGFDAQQITSYVAKYCEQFPLEAVTLLQSTILGGKEPWWAPKGEDEEKILRAAIGSGHIEAKRIALEVINYRGERGDFRWKPLLA